jgi:pimeloyl-ACP methyl ester carboxylesterase
MTETLPTAQPRSHTIELRGLRFHYVDWGGDHLPLVVFLHGFTGHARTWDHAARSVADRFHVVALDQRGHGDTEWAGVYGSRAMVDDFNGFVDALGLERFSLVGASMGGINAYCFAGEHPERVERLAIVDIGPDMHRPGIERIMGNAGAATEFATIDDACEKVRAENPLADEDMLRHRLEHNVRDVDGGRIAWKWDPAMRDFTRPREEITRDEQWHHWREVRCPTLLLRGSESDILSVEIARRMLEDQPLARLVTIEGASHTVTMDRPVEHDAAIREFLLGGEVPSTVSDRRGSDPSPGTR